MTASLPANSVLYHGEPNGPSLAVLAALHESGLRLECQRIDLLGGARHLLADVTDPVARDFGVEGEGPVLVIEGEAMTESVFIAQFFDEAAGGVGLQPTDPLARWEMMMWCRRVTERAAPAAALLGGQAWAAPVLQGRSDAAFETILGSIVSDDLRARWQALRDGSHPAEAEADSHAKITDLAAQIEARLANHGTLRDWLMGSFTLADLETYAWIAGMPALVPAAFADKPHLTGWLARVAARPSVAWALGKATSPYPERHWAPGPEINRWG